MNDLDVLVVGAGPTGLTLAAQLARFGVRFRIIDKRVDRAGESRALGVQARSLEVLQALGLGERLASRGRTTTNVLLHVDREEPVAITLGNIGRSDTRFPYILFVSQEETEGVLVEHLTSCGVVIERSVELASFTEDSGGQHAVLRHADGRDEHIRVKYLAGCDGAHSTVRKQGGIPFEGAAYPQNFALGDVEADGLSPPGAIHAFGAGRGFAVFFPLGHPRTWRVMAIEGGPQMKDAIGSEEITLQPLSLGELQTMIGPSTNGSVTLKDPAWLTRFRLHHRQASRYQRGPIFLAGDAAHIHSPVGAQGMNTGIQDAWNLGWKIALVSQGRADARLLDTYHAERWPVGRTLLRATDRLFVPFARAASGGRLLVAMRRFVLRNVVARAFSRPWIRAFAFHFVSELGIHYRTSPAVTEGEPRLPRGPKAGDRLPDAQVARGHELSYLQQELSGPHLYLLLCGPLGVWDQGQAAALVRRLSGLLVIRYLTRDQGDDVLVDGDSEALTRLGIETSGQYLVRPDGHVAFRCCGTDLRSVTDYLEKWFRPLSN